MAFINSLCDALNVAVVAEFYWRCSTRFRELISTGEQKQTDTDLKVALALDWAQRRDLHPWLFEVFKRSEINTPKKDQLYQQETHLELNFVGEEAIVKNNLIRSTGNLATLGQVW